MRAGDPGSPAGRPPAADDGAEPTCQFRCDACGWAVECPVADRDRVERRGCRRCRSALTAGPPDPARWVPAPGDARRARRRGANSGVWVEVRRPGRQTDLAVALADLAPNGVGVWLSEPVPPGKAVEVTLVAGRRRLVIWAEVRWCAVGRDSAYRAGLRLNRRLTPWELADLVV